MTILWVVIKAWPWTKTKDITRSIVKIKRCPSVISVVFSGQITCMLIIIITWRVTKLAAIVYSWFDLDIKLTSYVSFFYSIRDLHGDRGGSRESCVGEQNCVGFALEGALQVTCSNRNRFHTVETCCSDSIDTDCILPSCNWFTAKSVYVFATAYSISYITWLMYKWEWKGVRNRHLRGRMGIQWKFCGMSGDGCEIWRVEWNGCIFCPRAGLCISSVRCSQAAHLLYIISCCGLSLHNTAFHCFSLCHNYFRSSVVFVSNGDPAWCSWVGEGGPR